MEEFNHFAEFAQQVDVAVNKLVRRAAFGIERSAKKRAPVDTGAMRNSIYTRTEQDETSNYSKAVTGATQRGRALHLYPEVPPPMHNEAWVAVGVDYGIYVELGTSRMSAKPYFFPAVEEVAPKFVRALERLLEHQGATEITISAEIAGDLPGAP